MTKTLVGNIQGPPGEPGEPGDGGGGGGGPREDIVIPINTAEGEPFVMRYVEELPDCFAVLRVICDYPAWVRIYPTMEDGMADAARSDPSAPPLGKIYLDVETYISAPADPLDVVLSPVPICTGFGPDSEKVFVLAMALDPSFTLTLTVKEL